MSVVSARKTLLGRPAPPGHRWVSELSVASFPYLADHRLQGLIILPGSAYLEMALAAATAVDHKTPSTIEDISFERAFVVPSEGTRSLHIALSRGAGRAWEFAATAADKGIRHARARLVDAGAPVGSLADRLRLNEADPQQGADLDAESFYRRLSNVGNAFGHAFRRLERCRVSEGAAVGVLRATATCASAQPQHLFDSTLLDTAMQVLTATTDVAGHTFALVGCERLTLHRTGGDAVQVHARMRPGRNAADELVGDAAVVDGEGRPILDVAGVRLRCLQLPVSAVGPPAAAERASTTIAVAASFTAEPLKDALSFWFDTLAVAATISFAPYNQTFQQLLDPASPLRSNSGGANVMLVRVEDLAWQDTITAPRGHANGDPLPANRPHFSVPGVGEIAHLANYETEFLYDEIFRRQAYLRHGIALDDGACVFDVGANIGLFTLFVRSRCPDARIFAFEPCPPIYELLRANAAAYPPGAVTFDCGLADANAERPFVYYPHSPAFSSFVGDEVRDRAVVETVVRNALRTRLAERAPALDPLVGQFMHRRLDSETYRCRTRTLSSIIAEHDIERIDLLKIDAEGSELGVLAGIDDEHWPLIHQIVAEVHSAAAAQMACELLQRRGFDVVSEAAAGLLRDTGFVHLFARSKDRANAGRPKQAWAETLERNADDFVQAVAVMQKATRVPCLVAVCPRSARADRASAGGDVLDDFEARLADRLAAVAGVHVLTPADIQRAYPVADYADARAEEWGGIPYSHSFFAALATMTARRLMALWQPPIKCIVLDCDNTLWAGVCGEDGPTGVYIDPGRRALQDFVVRQHELGTLVCLCSRNHPADVYSVLARREDMPLRLSHVAASRLNWEKKSANLASLAAELDLGLESFAFIDDDPVECAEVRANRPEVLTLCLPADAAKISHFLDHVWAFDRIRVTDADRARTDQYRRERQRRAWRGKAMTLASFIAGLELRVETRPCTPAERARVAQLSMRTNQFNTTTIRRSEAELDELLDRNGLECWTVRVEDRFGDYGLVGATLFRAAGGVLRVDALLLSCRALGRGVEHRMMAMLGGIAQQRGLTEVAVQFIASGRNEPARRFLADLATCRPGEDGAMSFTIAADAAASLVFAPADSPGEQEPTGLVEAEAPTGVMRWDSILYQRIATDLADVDAVAAAAKHEQRRRRPVLRSAFAKPDDDLERELAELWQRRLGVEEVGVDDNFFELGGTSLLAVQIMAELNQRLGIAVPTTAVFEGTSIRGIAAMLRVNADATGTSGQRRGQRRRDVSRGARAQMRGAMR